MDVDEARSCMREARRFGTILPPRFWGAVDDLTIESGKLKEENAKLKAEVVRLRGDKEMEREGSKGLDEMLQKSKAEVERLREEKRGCPCLYTTPCHERCTCVTPVSSVGCSRCARYGSVDQRRAAAEYLAGLAAEVERLREELIIWKRIRTPTHGPCCTCQACGLDHDSCRCDLDEVADEVEKLRKEKKELASDHVILVKEILEDRFNFYP